MFYLNKRGLYEARSHYIFILHYAMLYLRSAGRRSPVDSANALFRSTEFNAKSSINCSAFGKPLERAFDDLKNGMCGIIVRV